MSSEVKTSNVEDVLPNDEELGRRNRSWRQFIKKFEDAAETRSEHSMDIDTAVMLLDQAMSDESSVRDVVEASSDGQSVDESAAIKRQVMAVVPLRKRQWEANGLKEILDDNEFRMLSHEKVENWLRNHMHTITGEYNVHCQTKEVTTVTEETQMDADADSMYSVDTAQYIRTNKQIKSKVKVTTMIKRYSVTGSVQRLSGLGVIPDEQPGCLNTLSTLPQQSRAVTKSDSACDDRLRKPIALRNRSPMQTLQVDDHDRPLAVGATEPPPANRRNRRKVFKKTIPRKRKSVEPQEDQRKHSASAACKQRYDPAEIYDKALEMCVQCKKTKQARRKVPKRVAAANRRLEKFTSFSDPSDSDDVFVEQTRATKPTALPSGYGTQRSPPEHRQQTPSPCKSPTEREIVEPLKSITLSATKRPRPQPAGPEQAPAVSSTEPTKKCVGFRADSATGHDKGLVIYRPKAIQPNLPASDRVRVRVGDLTLTGVTKQRHLDKFQEFDYHVHPNSTIHFYPSDSSEAANESGPNGAAIDSSTENSYDDDDPILTFNPRHSRLHVVEVPYRRDRSCFN